MVLVIILIMMSICLLLTLIYLIYEYRVSYKKLRVIGEIQVKLQYRFESYMIFLPIYILFFSYHASNLISDGYKVLAILMITLLFLFLGISIYGVYGSERICINGIVTHQGVFFWRDIIYYHWNDEMLTGKRVGITFQVKKGKRNLDISLPLKNGEIEVVGTLIRDNELNVIGPI